MHTSTEFFSHYTTVAFERKNVIYKLYGYFVTFRRLVLNSTRENTNLHFEVRCLGSVNLACTCSSTKIWVLCTVWVVFIIWLNASVHLLSWASSTCARQPVNRTTNFKWRDSEQRSVVSFIGSSLWWALLVSNLHQHQISTCHWTPRQRPKLACEKNFAYFASLMQFGCNMMTERPAEIKPHPGNAEHDKRTTCEYKDPTVNAKAH